ncbi:MAG: acylphosphatase [Acidiferrobacter sp.]
MACIRLRVRGRVQGVGFRVYVRDQARGLGVTGWVRNRADGSVEVLACGPEAALESLTKLVSQGPIAARVTHVAQELGLAGALIPESFLVRYDED